MKAGRWVCGVFLGLCAAASLACWRPDVGASELKYVATQAGTDYAGTFREFDGEVCLDPAAPASGHIDLRVDPASVDSGIPELDAALQGELFLATARWPRVTFESTAIEALGGDRYRVTGNFTLRGTTETLTVPFTFTAAGDTARLQGETAIRRLNHDVGLGEWRNVEFLDNAVKLTFDVKLVPAAE